MFKFTRTATAALLLLLTSTNAQAPDKESALLRGSGRDLGVTWSIFDDEDHPSENANVPEFAVPAKFREDHLLRDDFDPPGQTISRSAKNIRLGNDYVDLDNLEDFGDLGDIRGNVYRSADDPRVLVIYDADGDLEEVCKIGRDGSYIGLHRADKGSSTFFEVYDSDYDSSKLGKAAHMEAPSRGGGRRLGQDLHTALKDKYDHEDHHHNHRQLATCNSYKVIEVVISYDSYLCSFEGGSANTENNIAAVVAKASLYYEDFCYKVKVGHLDANCNSGSDPYRSLIDNIDNECTLMTRYKDKFVRK